MAGTTTVDRGGSEYAAELYATPGVGDYVKTLDVIGGREVDRYQSAGYLAVQEALTDAEIAGALTALAELARPRSPAGIQYEQWAEDILDDLPPERRMDATRKYMQFAEHDERLNALAHHPGLLAVVERLLGGAPHMFQDMALLKPPGGGREKPWHQDNAFFHMVPGTPIVGVWIALDEATTENGCMRVIPGSHQEGPVRHAFLRDLQICDGDVPVDRGVAVPLPPGGLMLFDGLMQHGTPANESAHRRRALQFHYTIADPEHTTKDEHRAVFGWADGAQC